MGILTFYSDETGEQRIQVRLFVFDVSLTSKVHESLARKDRVSLLVSEMNDFRDNTKNLNTRRYH